MIVQSGGDALAQRVRAVQLEVVSDDCRSIYEGQPRCSSVVAELATLGFRPLTPALLCTPMGARTRHGASCEAEVVFVSRDQKPGLAHQPDFVLDAQHLMHNGCSSTHEPEDVEELLKSPRQVVAVVHQDGQNVRPGFRSRMWQGASASSRGHTYSCPKCCFDRAACRDEGLVRRLGGRNVATCPF